MVVMVGRVVRGVCIVARVMPGMIVVLVPVMLLRCARRSQPRMMWTRDAPEYRTR